MATINTNGITIKSLSQWKTALEAMYLAVDPEWDLSTNTPDGQVIASLAEALANADESILDGYNSADPDKAMGQALDAIMGLSNIKRREGTFSTATVQLSGTDTTVVPAGTQIENAVTGTKWATDSEVVLSGSTDVGVTCATIGAETAGIGELSKIATPVSGLDTATNAAAATLGQNPMTNTEARAFREQTISNTAQNSVDAIQSAIALVDGVTHSRVYNNRSGVTDSNGLPAHSIAIFANGGSDADVAAAVYSRINPGPTMHAATNDVTQNVVSADTGNDEDIVFNRPVLVPLFIEVNLTQTGSALADGTVDAIKQAIVDYSHGNLFDADSIEGYTKSGFRIGQDISSGMIHTPVNYIIGNSGQAYVTTINIDDASSPSSPGTVAIDYESLATVDVGDIDVVIT